MKTAAILTLLLSLRAAAETCIETSTSACTPSDAEKTEIMREIKAGIQAKKDMEEAAKAVEKGSDVKTRIDRSNDQLQSMRLMQAHFDGAIALTVKYYHLTPAMPAGAIARPKGPGTNPGADWATNAPVAWSPEFYGDKSIYMKITGSDKDKLDHYFGDMNIGQVGGETFLNGKTIITPVIFNSAEADGNPGVLAYIIHHEAVHFMELTRRGWDNFDEGEVRAYRASIAAADIFELDKNNTDEATSWKMQFKNEIKYHLARIRELGKNNLRPMFLDKDEEDVYKSEFDRYESEEQKLVKQIQALKLLAEQEERDRREEAAKTAKAQLLDEVNRQIRDCGFEPDYRENGHVFSGFRREIRGWPSTYAISHNITLDEFKVGLMFARACLGVTMEGVYPDETAPCNEAFTITNQHWNEPGFKEDAQLEVNPPEQLRCMDYLHDHWTAPMSMDRFASMLSQAKKEYQKAVDARWRQQERERRERESSERSGREAQEGRDGSDRGSQDGRHPHAPLHCRFNSNGAYCD